MNNQKSKQSKGITLIALIITILVLLILALVAIGALQNTGIIIHAQNATTEYHSKQDEEEIKLAVEEWKIVKHTQTSTNFGSFLKSKFGENNVSKNDEDEFYIVTIAKCGHKYKVYEDGRIEKVTGIFLNKTSIKLDIAEGVTTTEELTATLNGITGTIQWENDNEGIATISAIEGETITVTINQGATGTAIITAKCGEETATCVIKVSEPIEIGDKVAYNEGYSATKTNTIDSAFVMDDLEWRVLDIEEDGTVELISTKPTTSTLTLTGKQGYLKGPENLDKLCNDLYANGTGVTARSLKVEDIDKLAGIKTDADKKALNSDYGSLWQYQYLAGTGTLQYRTSKDNGSTWSEWKDSENQYSFFNNPFGNSISRTNNLDANGNPIVTSLISKYYYYYLDSKIPHITSDGISMASLISKGLNKSNDTVSSENITQWLSSSWIDCWDSGAHYSLFCLTWGKVFERRDVGLL